MRVQVNYEMGCQVFQHNEDKSKHQGKFIDLKQYPDRAEELLEAKEWPEFGNFIADINRCKELRTCGCTASGKTPGGYEAPFVDIAFDNAALANYHKAYDGLANSLLACDSRNSEDNFVVELCDCSATLPDGENIKSLRLWLLGQREEASIVFAELLEALRKYDPSPFQAMAESIYAKEQKQKLVGKIKLWAFLIGWLLMACVFAYFGWGWLGWVGLVMGFILGIVLPIIVIALQMFCF